MAGRRRRRLLLLLLLLLGLALLLEGCLGQGAAEPITDRTFKALVAACLDEAPADGACGIAGGAHGPMSGWDVSMVTDMAGIWSDGAGGLETGSASGGATLWPDWSCT